MANYMSVDPSEIYQSASRFRDVSDTARRIEEDTTDGVDRLTPIGGGDEFGKQFDDRFFEALNAANGVLSGTRDGFKATDVKLTDTADEYVKVNDFNASHVPKL
jgi:uncharacterized protein YukE